jgi:hypothetical protein
MFLFSFLCRQEDSLVHFAGRCSIGRETQQQQLKMMIKHVGVFAKYLSMRIRVREREIEKER